MNSKVYYGNTFLDVEDLSNKKINRIELQYYRTKKRKAFSLKESTASYGIEIVKKEYLGKKVKKEKEKLEKVSSKKNKVDFIIDTLKKFKVTPITLKDVVEDMTKS